MNFHLSLHLLITSFPFMRITYRLTFQTTQRKFANKKWKKIQVEKQDIRVALFNDQEYVCLNDMMPSKDGEFFVSDWLRNRNTLEFLGIWQSIHNPSFNYGEFAAIKSQSGLNHFKLSVKNYISLTRGNSRNGFGVTWFFGYFLFKQIIAW